MIELIDFYNSFINTYVANSIQFSIDSYCFIIDKRTKIKKDFYHCSSMKSENTFGLKNLFLKNPYDFTVVFGKNIFKIFRSGIYSPERIYKYIQYKDVPPGYNEKYDEDIIRDDKYIKNIVKLSSYFLKEYDLINEYVDRGKRIVAKTIIEDDNKKAIIYYPVKCFNNDKTKKVWQVDTGPIIFPVLSEIKENDEMSCIKSIRLANIAFNSIIDNTYFLIEKPIKRGNKYVCYFDEIKKQKCINKLFGYKN
jgi:hypothetical protein